jgi:hypothetical protein
MLRPITAIRSQITLVKSKSGLQDSRFSPQVLSYSSVHTAHSCITVNTSTVGVLTRPGRHPKMFVYENSGSRIYTRICSGSRIRSQIAQGETVILTVSDSQ